MGRETHNTSNPSSRYCLINLTRNNFLSLQYKAVSSIQPMDATQETETQAGISLYKLYFIKKRPHTLLGNPKQERIKILEIHRSLCNVKKNLCSLTSRNEGDT